MRDLSLGQGMNNVAGPSLLHLGRRVFRAVVAAGALLVLYLGVGYFAGNVAPVVEGEVWRAGQLSGPALERFIEDKGIRSIINLRGPQQDGGWYDEEVATAKRTGAVLHDMPLSSRRVLGRAEADVLVALMRDAPKPMLIHCEGGADRTGLAAALYLSEVEGVDENLAGWQLSPIYGHFSIPGRGAWAMDESWANLSR